MNHIIKKMKARTFLAILSGIAAVLGTQVIHSAQDQGGKPLPYPFGQLFDQLSGDQLIPFTITVHPYDEGFICEHPGNAGSGLMRLVIDGNTPFALTSIHLSPLGADELEDRISISNLLVDGLTISYVSHIDLLADGFPTPNSPIEVLGAPVSFTSSSTGIPTRVRSQITSNGDPGESMDIQLWISCEAHSTSDISFHSIQVSGWKQRNEALSVTYN